MMCLARSFVRSFVRSFAARKLQARKRSRTGQAWPGVICASHQDFPDPSFHSPGLRSAEDAALAISSRTGTSFARPGNYRRGRCKQGALQLLVEPVRSMDELPKSSEPWLTCNSTENYRRSCQPLKWTDTT